MPGRSSHGILLAALLFCASCAHKEAVSQPASRPLPRSPKVALALGAGSSKGFAHVGVLKILEAANVPIHLIVGTSAGSFVGCFYAYGYNTYQLQRLAFSLEKGDIADLTVPDNGFIKGEKLEEYVNKAVRNTPLEKMRIPFYTVATDIGSGQEFVFGSGNAGKAVRASCSIPGVFRPVAVGDRMYIDGGVVSPVAVDAARRLGADIVIAVDISAGQDAGPAPVGTVDTLLQSIGIMYSRLSAAQLSRADIVIRPKVGHIGASDFSRRHEAILEGEIAAREALPRIRAVIEAAAVTSGVLLKTE